MSTKIKIHCSSEPLYLPHLTIVPREGEYIRGFGDAYYKVVGVVYSNKGYDVDVYTAIVFRPTFVEG